jgi:hypothetical protein
MHSPFLFALGLATAFAPVSTAHTVFTTLFVDDVNQGDGTCIRMAKEGNVATHPIAGGLDTEDMACGKPPEPPNVYFRQMLMSHSQAETVNRPWHSPARPRLAPS